MSKERKAIAKIGHAAEGGYSAIQMYRDRSLGVFETEHLEVFRLNVPKQPKDLKLNIFLKTGEWIGLIGKDEGMATAEIWIEPAWRNRGYEREAMAGFNEWEKNPGQEASRRPLECVNCDGGELDFWINDQTNQVFLVCSSCAKMYNTPLDIEPNEHIRVHDARKATREEVTSAGWGEFLS